MLSSLTTFDEQAIDTVHAWLRAYRNIEDGPLQDNDPEHLIERGGTTLLLDTYRRKRATALWNGYQLLAMRDQRGWAIHEARFVFENILRDIEGASNSWFFAIATRKPDERMVAGACLMLKRHFSTEAMPPALSKPSLEHLRVQLARNIPAWTKLAVSYNERAIFQNLRQRFTAGSSFNTSINRSAARSNATQDRVGPP
jgi:hypothetical protein